VSASGAGANARSAMAAPLTVPVVTSSHKPPRYRRMSSGPMLDPFKDEIHRLLKQDPALPGQGMRELIAPMAEDPHVVAIRGGAGRRRQGRRRPSLARAGRR
jgi:hypothetical protein